MRKNTPVYCRLQLYGNLRELNGNKSNTFCLYERKKYIKVFYNNNFDNVSVTLCCLLFLVHGYTHNAFKAVLIFQRMEEALSLMKLKQTLSCPLTSDPQPSDL